MSRDRDAGSRRVLWRRIGAEGMDACAFDASGDGCVISGVALFRDGAGPARLDYEVRCAPDWSTLSASVAGWVGATDVSFAVARCPGDKWTVNGEPIGGVGGLRDIDLGFTPATNTNAIRRLGLAVGAEADTTAVWLDTEDWSFKPLRQVYRRVSETAYAYRSPSHDYAAELVTDAFGIIQLYPQLWTALPQAAD